MWVCVGTGKKWTFVAPTIGLVLIMRTETHLQMEDTGFPLFGCCQVIKWKTNKIVNISCLESATYLALLFNANSAIFQLYHDENKLIFTETTVHG
jgi:hypothetical protein